MNAREVIERLSKDELVDLVLEYSDNGYFPLEPFQKPGNMRIRKVILAQIY